MNYPTITNQMLLQRLESPTGKIRMVLDTDTYNEVDDQFALAYALRAKDKLDLKAIYAAPFFNDRSSSPSDGMNRSYNEICNILNIMGENSHNRVFKGSKDYLKDKKTPQQSEAATNLIELAMESDPENPLYVVAIGAITNIASAILMEPKIIEKIVVVWLGGHAHFWPDTKEFNLMQDVLSAQIIFDCGVPLVQIPCAGVTTHLLTTISELEHYLDGKSEIGTYLTDIVRNYTKDTYAWSKVIWDISAVAWLINPHWVPTNLVHSPIVTDQVTWSLNQSRHLIRCAHFIHRDPIFGDLFKRLSE